MQKLATPEEAQKIVASIIEAYDKTEIDVKPILGAFRQSRKYGLPVVSAIDDEEEALIWATRFVLSLVDCWPDSELTTLVEDELFIVALLEKSNFDYALFMDAKSILSIAIGNKSQI